MIAMAPDSITGPWRRSVYTLLIVTSLAVVVARILAVCAADRRTPFLSANDRSRWCTVRALVEDGTYEIDRLQQIDGWKTIDKVRHVGWDGRPHYYSSKPPLLPTLLAGQYWVSHRVFRAALGDRPFAVGRTLLIINNVLPLLLYFWLLSRIVERWGTTDWGRLYVMTTAAWGTYLTTFAITLNNHLVAAICTMVVLYLLVGIWYEGRARGWRFFLAGLAAGFAAANELPALSLVALAGAGLLWKFPGPTLRYFLPALVLVAAAFFGTNYLAHGDWRPAYAHREWYDYPGSYWLDANRRGIDRGEASPVIYAWNVLLGHHGIFLLTPVWILSLIGIAGWARRSSPNSRPALAWTVATLTIVCLAFYLTRPMIDRNYGGTTSGFRWMFWFTPLWLVTLLPVADWLSYRRGRRALGLALLAVSVLSASYPVLNPWQHPWVYRLGQYLGWIGGG